jgi:hypothetical protein
MKGKPVVLLLISATLVSVVATVGGLLYRKTVRDADFEAERFGFPYYWREHVTATFGGRADIWNTETWNFATNFILFFAASCGALLLAFVWKSKRSQFGAH